MQRNRVVLVSGVVILSLQAVLTYALARKEFLPSPPPLAQSISWKVGHWSELREEPVDSAVYEMLSPDELLQRTYQNSQTKGQLDLFVVYYKTQLRAKNAHDPKVCLPGSGWEPQISKVITVPAVPGGVPFESNYYVVAKDGKTAVVLYWYQTQDRVFAVEQGLRLSRVVDNVMKNRTDMALVRVVVPVLDSTLEAATQEATQFAGTIYTLMQQQFPPSPKKT